MWGHALALPGRSIRKPCFEQVMGFIGMQFPLGANTPKTIWRWQYGRMPRRLLVLQIHRPTLRTAHRQTSFNCNRKASPLHYRRLILGRLAIPLATIRITRMAIPNSGTSSCNENWVHTRSFPSLTWAVKMADFLIQVSPTLLARRQEIRVRLTTRHAMQHSAQPWMRSDPCPGSQPTLTTRSVRATPITIRWKQNSSEGSPPVYRHWWHTPGQNPLMLAAAISTLRMARAADRPSRTFMIRVRAVVYRPMTSRISCPGPHSTNSQRDGERGGLGAVQLHGSWEIGKRTSSFKHGAAPHSTCRWPEIWRTCEAMRQRLQAIICVQT